MKIDQLPLVARRPVFPNISLRLLSRIFSQVLIILFMLLREASVNITKENRTRKANPHERHLY